MTFNLSFPSQNPDMSELRIEAGQMLFVLGANGTGKSALMHRYTAENGNAVRKISAHRQTWMGSDALDMAPSIKVQTEQNIQNQDRQQQARYRDPYAAQRASITLFELIDAENVRARAIADAYGAGRMEEAREAAKKEAPIAEINELLLQSNIPIKISVRANARLMAQKDGGMEYSAAELSDGERNALLIAGNVLTAPPNSLLIIDEPERHLHRSIISPLLSQLFQRRSDCAFVVSTHDHDLPLENPRARILLLRSCSFSGSDVRSWEADEFASDAPIDDKLKRDLLGARRRILFVEGTESSLDKPLYSLLFPLVSVIPKGSCREVEQSVVGVRAGEGFHWLQAFGIADNDGFDEDQIAEKKEKGVYAVPYYSVEAIYYHPTIIDLIAKKQTDVSGDDREQLFRNAMNAGVAAIVDHTDRLSRKVAKKAIRKRIMEQIPNDDELMTGGEIRITNDPEAIINVYKCDLVEAVEESNWEAILLKTPIRESGAREGISKALKFQSIEDYEKAVRHLLTIDEEALTLVRGFFEDLSNKILE